MKKNEGNPAAPQPEKKMRSKRLRYGGYSAVIVVVALVLLMVLNVGVSTLEERFGLKIDLTKNSLYSLSAQTNDLLKGLDEDIYIYTTYTASQADATVDILLEQYLGGSLKVHVENIDPVQNPTAISQFTKDSLENGSLIITNADKSKSRIIKSSSLVGTDDSGSYTLQAEQRISGAILYVVSDNAQRVLFLDGHGETTLSTLDYLKTYLENENCEVSTVNLTGGETALEKGDILVIMAPKQDITLEEREQLRDFMINGGRTLYIADPMATQLTNFDSLLSNFDIELKNAVVLDPNQANYYQAPLMLVPNLGEHAITQSIRSSRMSVLLPSCRYIQLPQAQKDDVKITPLLTTSDQAFAKEDLTSETLDPNPAEGDVTGQLTLAAAVELTDFDVTDNDSQLVVIGTSGFVGTENLASYGANLDLFMNAINWMSEDTDTFTVRAKSLSGYGLQIPNDATWMTLAIILVAVIPLAIGIIGFVVYRRRKHL
ncbi:MAG: GldG family protein [Christensenellales bacterium]|jgi:ABC-2 type transport system permease protein